MSGNAAQSHKQPNPDPTDREDATEEIIMGEMCLSWCTASCLGKGSKKKGGKYGLLPSPPPTPPRYGLFSGKYKILTCFLAIFKPF